MEKVDQHLIESMKQLMIQEPEKYMEDYIYLTYDYAFFVAEQGSYKAVADLMRESIDAMIWLKSSAIGIQFDKAELHDMALGFHDLMIEMVESGYYDLAEEMRGWIRKMLDAYEIILKNK